MRQATLAPSMPALQTSWHSMAAGGMAKWPGRIRQQALLYNTRAQDMDSTQSPQEQPTKRKQFQKKDEPNLYLTKHQKMEMKSDLVRRSQRLLIPWHMLAAGFEVVSALGPLATREQQHLPAAWWKLRALPPSPAYAVQPSCSPTICRKMETNTQSIEVLSSNFGTFHWSLRGPLSTKIFKNRSCLLKMPRCSMCIIER